MDVFFRNQELSQLFSYEKRTKVEASQLDIVSYHFRQTVGTREIYAFQKTLPVTEFYPLTDDHIEENKSFVYTVFSTCKEEKNPNKLFNDTRLFMFCGGSIFSEMNGNARDIMDKKSYERLANYYTNDFLGKRDLPYCFPEDIFEKAFKAMICPDSLKEERESFFRQACNRIRAISLKNDIVMPTEGIIKALGKASEKILEELHFSFDYSHQVPFPLNTKVNKEEVDKAFRLILGKAAYFLK